MAVKVLSPANPIRFSTLALSAVSLLACLAAILSAGMHDHAASAALNWPRGLWLLISVLLVAVGLYDVMQTRHAILRNYPILGHMRFWLEFIRPEMRQYFIESDTEAQPFSRAQRSVVYQRAKGDPDNRPFGTQLDTGSRGYEWINHSLNPTRIESHDFRIWIGGEPGGTRAGAHPCTQPYFASIFNISAMSFGALSANAVQSLNAGAKAGGFAHDTGEGSISRYHREHGGDLIWEIGSGYFGCRDANGHFSEEKFREQARSAQVKMIEIKLSQGAKPGHGGVLPAAKITQEIAEARGVPMGRDCVSPSAHSTFSTPAELMRFIARLRELSGGKPTGFKLCIGHPWEWFAIVKAMLETDITPDFIVVDGAEGGTGAAPVEFSDHVGTPLQEGLRLVHNTLRGVGLRDRVKIGCAGKVITAFDIARMCALGADWCNAARGFMMAVGCIQAQSCHTGHCPTGVTTQDPIRQRALVVSDKSQRVAQFHANTLHALKELLQAAGLEHPDQISSHHIARRISDTEVRQLSGLMPIVPERAILDDLARLPRLFRLHWPLASAHSFAPQEPEPDEAELANLAMGQDSTRPQTAYEVARQLSPARHSRSSAPPSPPAPVKPSQARHPAEAPASETEVPTQWTGSDNEAPTDARTDTA